MPATLRLLEVHTCPLWDAGPGLRVVGMDDYREYGFKRQPEVVGWVNVGQLELHGRIRSFLLTKDAG